jgi:CHAD domain-containing protein
MNHAHAADVGIGVHEPLGPALARIAAGQFDRITAGLRLNPDRDAAVHDARKALKRLRALLRLVRDHLGEGVFRQEDVVLRDLGRRLAAARDARTCIDTLRALGPSWCEVLQERLVDDHRGVSALLLTDTDLMGQLLTTARCARERWVTSLPGLVRDEFAEISPGLRRTYRRGRRRMGRALDRPTDEAFHEWRKEVKHLQYQMESLRPIDPLASGGVIASLASLGEVLGTEHDHTVLGSVAGREGGCNGEAARVLELLQARKEELRISAVPLAKRVYSAKSGKFVRRIGARWETARTGSAGFRGAQR